MSQDDGLLPLPLEEGWGEGLRSLERAMLPHPDRYRDPTSPRWGGELLALA